jgi:hypothetical protein
MRVLALILTLFAAGVARADWVFEEEWSYWPGHLCWGDSDYWPPIPGDFPWDQVAYGELQFSASGDAKFWTADPVRITATCGELLEFTWSVPDGVTCWDLPDCHRHVFNIRAEFVVQRPTSNEDLFVRVYSDECGHECDGYQCESAGEVIATLTLYSETTATAINSWSTVKSLY